MRCILIIISCLCVNVFAHRCSLNVDNKNNPEIGLSTVDLIIKYGYPVQVFTVVSSDGYLLNLVRIPYSKDGKTKSNRQPVLLMHGMAATTDEFLYIGRNQSLPIFLSDRGYDVWMGNARGNKYSQKHVSLSPTSREFWDFSWEEIALFDAPAFIDKILAVTGEKKVSYIGHSQGGTVFYLLLSMKPEYNDKIKIGINLGPAVFLKHMKSPIFKLIAMNFDLPLMTTRLLGLNTLHSNELTNIFTQIVCRKEATTNRLCANILFEIMGNDTSQFFREKLPLILSNYPGGASMKQVTHYAQLVKSGLFAQFDYGAQGNMKKYGTKYPPKYPLERVSAPNAIMYGENDIIIVPEDLRQLKNAVQNCVEFYKVPYPLFNHVDFIFAKDVIKLVYNEIHAILQRY